MDADKLKELLANNRTESQHLDYKETIVWDGASDAIKAGIVKDIMAFANVKDGGVIVVGVTDAGFQPIGVSEETFNSIDQTRINSFVQNFTDPLHFCNVHKIELDGKYFIVIEVPEFREVPIICKRDCDKLLKGQIYYRTEKASSEPIKTVEHMRELLGRGLVHKRDELLAAIDAIVKGRPSRPEKSNTEQYEQGYEKSNKLLMEYEKAGIIQAAHWGLVCFPAKYVKIYSSHSEIRKAISEAAIKSPGWYFPFPGDQDDYVNRENAVVSNNNCYAALFDGLFVWNDVIHEDAFVKREDDSKVLEWRRSIIIMRLLFEFIKRYYRNTSVEAISYRVFLTGSKGRRLISMTPGSLLWLSMHECVSHEETVAISGQVGLVELQASFDSTVAKAILQLYALFNCNEIKEDLILSQLSQISDGNS